MADDDPPLRNLRPRGKPSVAVIDIAAQAATSADVLAWILFEAESLATRGALRRIPETLRRSIVACLTHFDDRVRRNAVDACRALGLREGMGQIGALLGDPEQPEAVRLACAEAVIRMPMAALLDTVLVARRQATGTLAIRLSDAARAIRGSLTRPPEPR